MRIWLLVDMTFDPSVDIDVRIVEIEHYLPPNGIIWLLIFITQNGKEIGEDGPSR